MQEIKEIRQEIFNLALQSPTLEIMHWYMWLDECFENDDFSPNELGSIKWRCLVLNWQHQPINKLSWMIDTLVKSEGYNLNDIKVGIEQEEIIKK